MGDFPNLPNWSSRNPLSILALFIALIYGMAALLFGTSIKSLNEINQTILVVFLVIFPPAVLGVFAWLVAKHHPKLYSPSEFRSDDGFYNNSSPSNFGARFEGMDSDASPASTEAIEGDGSAAPENQSRTTPETPQLEPPPTPPQNALTSNSGGSNALLSSQPRHSGLLAETLVFQELQQEFNAAIKRDILFATGSKKIPVDGVIELDGSIIVVDVLIARSSSTYLNNIKRSIDRLTPLNIRTIIAIVADENYIKLKQIKIDAYSFSNLGSNLDIRVYGLNELMKKFGLS